MAWGGKEYGAIFKNMRRDGLIHPAEKSRPALRDDCIEFFDAFRSLGASRLWNQVGPQPVSIVEIEAYLRLHGIDDHDERLKYLKFIQLLDGVEIKNHYDKAKTK